MGSCKQWKASALVLTGVVVVLAAALTAPPRGVAQDRTSDPGKHKHADKSADTANDLAAQVRDLQSKIAKLEAALKQGHQGAPSGTSGLGGMPMGMGGKKAGMGGMMGMDMMMGGMGGKKKGMGTMSGMGMMDDMMGGMAGGQGMGGMGMMDDDMDMMGMMGMGGGKGSKGMGKMRMTAALPGFPGASHIYHIGATGFFLDHPEHITLATEQQTKLNRVKQKALLDKAKADRKIEEAEQELWELTGADEPDTPQIQAKIQEIEKLRGEQRLAFIRAVGEAAKVLTEEQRQVLLGKAKPDAHKAHQPPAK